MDMSPRSGSRVAGGIRSIPQRTELTSRIPKRESHVPLSLKSGKDNRFNSDYSAAGSQAPGHVDAHAAHGPFMPDQDGPVTMLGSAPSCVSTVASGKIPAWADENGQMRDDPLTGVLDTIFYQDQPFSDLCSAALETRLTRTKDGGTDASRYAELVELTKTLRRCVRGWKHREDVIRARTAEKLLHSSQFGQTQQDVPQLVHLQARLVAAEQELQSAQCSASSYIATCFCLMALCGASL
jgi:hypothetical protein